MLFGLWADEKPADAQYLVHVKKKRQIYRNILRESYSFHK